MKKLILISLLVFIIACSSHHYTNINESHTDWSIIKNDDEWFKSTDASNILNNIILFQRSNGGWPKNINYMAVLNDIQKSRIKSDKSKTDTTIDNNATIYEIRFLLRYHEVNQDEYIQTIIINGINFLLNAQYDNGGWPQYYPLRANYSKHITFNDDAMINVLLLFRDIIDNPPYFIDDMTPLLKNSFDKGIRLILDSQIVDGKRTAWGQQHHHKTLIPVAARTYEHPSIVSSESVPIVELLMGIDNPSDEIIAAVNYAMEWFGSVKLTGIDAIRIEVDGVFDRVVIEDGDAAPIWARFYEIGTNRPIFSGRDGIVRYSLDEIELERRVGYSWYNRRPSRLFDKYKVWKDNLE